MRASRTLFLSMCEWLCVSIACMWLSCGVGVATGEEGGASCCSSSSTSRRFRTTLVERDYACDCRSAVYRARGEAPRGQ